MNPNEPMSLTDGFLLTLLGSVPLWATAAFPYTSRPVSRICMAVSAVVVLNWVAIPLGRWVWKRLRQPDSRRLAPARYSGAR
jgi:hypothetical protein